MQTHYPPSQFVVPSPVNPGLQLHLKDPSSFWHVAFKWQLWRPFTHSSISTIQCLTESVWDSAKLTTYPSPNSGFCPKWEMELNWEWQKQGWEEVYTSTSQSADGLRVPCCGGGLSGLCLLIILSIFLFPATPQISLLYKGDWKQEKEKKSGILYFPNFYKFNPFVTAGE